MTGSAHGGPGDRVDRRVRRTKHALQHAMLELVVEKGLERVSVADVIERADVGRSTFYDHYRDKEDLFLSGIDDAIRAAFAGAASLDDGTSGPLWLFEHAREHLDLYRALVRRRGGWPLVRTGIEEILVEVFLERLAPIERDETLAEVAARFAAGSLLGVLTWWLTTGAEQPATALASTFQALANGGIAKATGVVV